jgi:hypothetical protein
MRDQLAAQLRKAAAIEAATARLLVIGRATLERSHDLLAWFSHAERSGWIPGRDR